MNTLPDIITNIVFEYLPVSDKTILNKNNYYLHNNVIIKENRHIYFIISNDLDFIFSQLLEKYKYTWIINFRNKRHFNFYNIKYSSFLEFLYDYCIYNNSNKCKMLMDSVIAVHIGIKWHKRKSIISYKNKWII